MRRAHVLLAGGVALAGIALARHGHGGDDVAPPAEIASAPLVATPSAPSATEIAKFEALADPAAPAPAVIVATIAPPSTTIPPPITAPAPLPAPVAVLADQLDLDHMVRVGDHYEAPLRDGRRAILTLDPELQALAEKLLDEARAPRGAIVAMAPDGRVLALAGRRSDAVKGGAAAKTGTADWHLATDLWAPAASVFKLVTASALVAAGVDPSDRVCFHGGLRSVNASNLVDDKHDSACQSLGFGVAHSQNAILGKLAFQHLDPAALDHTAQQLGLGGPLPGTELPGTTAQLAIPSVHDLTFAQTAAGFSAWDKTAATPTITWGSRLSVVGGALLAATFADDGEQPAPRLIDSLVDATGRHAPTTPTIAPRRALPPEVARAVSKMMVGTCEFGSASRSFGKRHGTSVAGKTGTLTTTEPFYMEYSWFVGYAPVEKPEIIVSVLLGNPENWHLKGHSAARRLIDLAISRASDRGPKLASRQDKREQW